ncbi:MAG: FliM/FliN family flagellar motor switch protein [SAR324 cluster bacterium]|jgi:flagellar motor switch protein FliN/FliY|nr:FliM/FliN family flagellar motor switch protein [Deltaproteobacteria bacterium]MDG1178273.1 FliM/FliN family flagellar motor switch protein [SAR324 cluster bacterium]RZO41637.1 MAG: flagellar motor switch protein FliN [Pseudomonadota bacterium]MDG1488226.1 FliM/FliN family flagellar motor switch protein [SAR324 cluster bacterium]MDG2065131.1 FliM/FliN family flagellar motor switch protein [SAR324 cluster bacterium]|tara:strand:- start:74 stop:370 length:297 start_codon:yes stop_codon:yes gene_type:complete
MSTETPEQESTLHKLKFLADASHVMQAEIARTDISLNEVMLWKKGTVVVLDKIVGSTIDVLIGDRLIARGEVVVINDRFGVRISEITHPDEKPKLGWK